MIGPSLTRQNSFLKMRGVLCLRLRAIFMIILAVTIPAHRAGGRTDTAASPGISRWSPRPAREAGHYNRDWLSNRPNMTQGIPEDVAGKYVPRVFLEQWQRGIQRTYLYELIDLPTGHAVGDSMFGLLRSDFSAKPAYTALTNLLHLLGRPGAARLRASRSNSR